MRARLLKPGFFLDEELAELHPLDRILFEGLWCQADRAGRLEDRPARIKAQALPYDKWDVDQALNRLAAAPATSPLKFIVRYEKAGTRLIQVRNFGKHQSPHVREPPSTLPAPDEPGAGPVLAPGESLPSTADPGSGSGSGKGGGSDPDLDPSRAIPVPPSTGPEPATPAPPAGASPDPDRTGAANRLGSPEGSAAGPPPPPAAGALVLPGPPAAAKRASAAAPKRIRVELEPDTLFDRALELWGRLWRDRWGVDYVDDRPDREALGMLLRDPRITSGRPGDLEALFRAYFADADPYLRRTKHPLRTLAATVNKYRAREAPPRPLPAVKPLEVPPPMTVEQQRVFDRAAELRRADAKLTREAAFARASAELAGGGACILCEDGDDVGAGGGR